MHTCYVPSSQINGEIATITGSEQHHLRNVIRMGLGDTIRIIDGKGNIFIAKVNRISTESTDAQIISREFQERRTPVLTLFQGIPKNNKMALILQKATELGITRIVPMSTERSLQKSSPNTDKRWQRVIIAATKQCKRAWLPELCEVQTFENCLNTLQTCAMSLIFSEPVGRVEERTPTRPNIKTVLRETPKVESIALLVGPEGGWMDKEVNAAIENGCIPVTIGSNTLRTETAAIAGITIAAYEYQL